MPIVRHLRIREAIDSDEEPIAAFCQNTFEWGDYIPHIWDRWFNDRSGRIFVAELRGLPVGMVHLQFLTPREGWLQGARVHPDYRRQGIATALTRYCFRFAEELGLTALRLTTSVRNRIAQNQVSKLGFAREFEWVSYVSRKVVAGGNGGWRFASLESVTEVKRFLASSDNFTAVGGRVGIMWVWHLAGRVFLSRMLRERGCLCMVRDGRISGLVLLTFSQKEESDERVANIAFLDGDETSVKELVAAVWSEAHKRGVKEVYAFATEQIR